MVKDNFDRIATTMAAAAVAMATFASISRLDIYDKAMANVDEGNADDDDSDDDNFVNIRPDSDGDGASM